ncbi:restriction endonuclease subunit S [Dorea sp. AM13-35]|nr:restriction endonuclease subunit S [Dorea sp. AM13-35]
MDMAKPKIRFNGYTEDWEQRKLGDIASSFEYGLNAAAKEYDGENKYIRITDIDDNTHEFLTDNLTSPDIDLTGADNYKLTEGDILFARTGASVGKSYIYRNSDGLVYYAGFLIRARIKEEYDAEFVFQNTLTDRYNKYIAVTSQRSGQPGVNAQEYAEFEIEVPKKEEQTKIGTYFRNIDHLITLHQRKCEQTKTLKKYMLQKMFPQDGEKVPQIRFEGFTEDWEQRKLGDLVDRVTRKNQDLVSELPLTISAQYGLIDQNEFFDKRVASKDVSGYYLIENGEFAYNKSTSTDAPWGAIKRLDRYENGVLSTLYIIFGIKENNPVDSDFLVSYYSTNLWHKGIHEIAAEGARNHGLLNIAPADFFATRLMIPQDIEEQKKIGKYFIELEALITLHQRKCDELKEVKKFMLQNMFV